MFVFCLINVFLAVFTSCIDLSHILFKGLLGDSDPKEVISPCWEFLKMINPIDTEAWSGMGYIARFYEIFKVSVITKSNDSFCSLKMTLRKGENCLNE